MALPNIGFLKWAIVIFKRFDKSKKQRNFQSLQDNLKFLYWVCPV